jgi:hypothetical protein
MRWPKLGQVGCGDAPRPWLPVVADSIEWVFAGCVDLEEAASRFYKASLLGPVLLYNDDETQRVMKQRRKDSVVQKVWDHNVAKTQLAGLMAGIGI